MTLPAAVSEADYDALPRAIAAYAEAGARIAARHGLAPGPVTRDPRGSLPVLDLGNGHVAKLFPPVWSEERAHEGAVLRFLAGSLPVAVPEVTGEGELDGWEYLLMTRVAGTCLEDAWPALDAGARATLARQTGALLRALHDLPVAGAPSALEWEPFLGEQVRRCVERQARLGLWAPWIDGLRAFVDSSGVLARAPRALLHTEVMPAHLLVQEREGRPQVTGLVDFEPAMVGDPEYELASLASFFFRTDASLWGPLEEGHGGFDEGWRGRAMAYTCLHRYANLPRYLGWLPPGEARTFDDLAARWFGEGRGGR